MKPLLYLLLAISTLASCSKDSDSNDQHCYECDADNDGVYLEAGCMTNSQYNSLEYLTDYNGTDVPKNQCRKK